MFYQAILIKMTVVKSNDRKFNILINELVNKVEKFERIQISHAQLEILSTDFRNVIEGLRNLMKEAMQQCEIYEQHPPIKRNHLKEAKFFYDVYHQLYAHEEFFEDVQEDKISLTMCLNSLREYLLDVDSRLSGHELPDYFNEKLTSTTQTTPDHFSQPRNGTSSDSTTAEYVQPTPSEPALTALTSHEEHTNEVVSDPPVASASASGETATASILIARAVTRTQAPSQPTANERTSESETDAPSNTSNVYWVPPASFRSSFPSHSPDIRRTLTDPPSTLVDGSFLGRLYHPPPPIRTAEPLALYDGATLEHRRRPRANSNGPNLHIGHPLLELRLPSPDGGFYVLTLVSNSDSALVYLLDRIS